MTKNTAPIKFEFEKFFTGKVVATGYMCFFYPKTRKKKLKVILIRNNLLIIRRDI